MPKQLEKTPQRLYRRSLPSPNTARPAVCSAYHRNIPHYNLFPISHVSKDENTKLLSAETNCAQYILPFRFLRQESGSTDQSLRCVEPGCFFFLGALGWCWIFVVALIKFSIRSHLIVKLIYYLDMFPKFPMCSQQHQLFVQYACCLLGTCIAESNLKTYMELSHKLWYNI
jgi:hypothetical protein